jgi:hypothetical protein
MIVDRKRRLQASFSLVATCSLFTACSGSVTGDEKSGWGAGADGGVQTTKPPVNDSTPPGVDDPGQAPGNTPNPGTAPNPGAAPTPPDDDGDPSTPNVPGTPDESQLGTEQVSVRRLSNREYNNTVRDLLGTELTPANNFLKETAHGFDNIAGSLGMTVTQYTAYFGAAADVAADVFTKTELRAPFEACGTESPDALCIAQTIRDFGARALRRPVSDDEVATYHDVYDRAVALGLTPVAAFEQVVRAMLASMEFLYRMEFDDTATEALHPVSGHELASRLSYFLWSTMPDDELFEAAASGQLSDADQVAAQVERMLGAPRATSLVDSFAWQWLGMGSLESHAVLSDSFPDWDEPLREAMLGEARQYLTEFVLGDAHWKDFLSADKHFVNSRLAAHYGAPDGYANDEHEFKPYSGDTPSRLGFMGTAGFLTVSSFAHRTSPTLRAKWVLETLLCSPPPPPPPELTIPDLDADEAANQAASIDNVRERLALHRSDPNCASCHSYLDPLGLALENFDAVGRYREDYADGTQIDPTGELPDGTPLAGLPDLVGFIGKDDRFMSCTAEKLFTYAMGRAPTQGDAPQLSDIETRWHAGTGAFPELVRHLVASVPFTQRQKASQE